MSITEVACRNRDAENMRGRLGDGKVASAATPRQWNVFHRMTLAACLAAAACTSSAVETVWLDEMDISSMECGWKAPKKNRSVVLKSSVRCYGVKIWQDGVLVRDFKPCVKNAGACLYDAVTKKIFYPLGGSLSAGPVGNGSSAAHE